jgi:murein DD-endopeptidase MepM/ murein hydrolase activator NlpD
VPHDDSHGDTAVPSTLSSTLSGDLTARSRRRARVLLLSACGAGLVGLALPGGQQATTGVTLSASTSSSPTVLGTEPAVRHGVVTVAPRPAPARATRSRSAATKRTTPAKPRRKTARWVAPSGAGIVSPYGMRWGRMHKGIDFGARYGAPIRAVGDGVVVGSGYLSSESGYGLITLIRHSNGVVTAYAHQSKSFVEVGDRVTAGERIGLVGSSGHSTGPHLHFEVRMSTHGGQVNPRTWLREHGVFV